jgi:hypothetical protein
MEPESIEDISKRRRRKKTLPPEGRAIVEGGEKTNETDAFRRKRERDC